MRLKAVFRTYVDVGGIKKESTARYLEPKCWSIVTGLLMFLTSSVRLEFPPTAGFVVVKGLSQNKGQLAKTGKIKRLGHRKPREMVLKRNTSCDSSTQIARRRLADRA